MRTETGKMPASFIFPIGNRPGESDERFGFIWYGCWMRWHSELSFGTMQAWLCARLALSLLLCSEDWLRRSPCASVMLKQGKRLGMALGLTGAVASPKPLRLGHVQARETAWHGARLNRGCGFASAKTVQVEAMAELVRKWPKRSPFSMQSKLKQGWLRRSPSVSAMSKQGKRLDMALDSIGALALRSACAIAAALQRR